MAGMTAVTSAVFVGGTVGDQPHNAFSHASKAVPDVGVVASSDGKLLKWLVSDGEHVEKGQLIAMLDVSQAEARISELRAQIAELEAKGSSAILPMTSITGTVPAVAPSPVKVPVKKSLDAPSPPAEAAKLASKEPFEAAKDALQKITASLKAQQAAEDQATKDIKDLTEKIAVAQANYKVASDKATNARALLEQGVISEKRCQEITADEDSSSRALSALLLDMESAKRSLASAKAELASLQAKLPTAKQTYDDAQAKFAAEKETRAKSIAALPPAKEEVVYRSVPTASWAKSPPTAPVKLFVDEETMDSVESKRKALQAELDHLKTVIEASKIYATEAGQVHLHFALAQAVVSGTVIATISR